MKKIIIYIILIVLVVWGIYALVNDDGVETDEAVGTSDVVVRGTVTAIDLEQAMVDGPYVMAIQSEDGVETVVNVPSMGIRLCANPDAIKNPSEFKVGDTAEVKGTPTPDGTIVPCESADHYLKAI